MIAENRREAVPAEAESPSPRSEDDVAVVLDSSEEKARTKALRVGTVCFLRSKGTGDKTIAITFKTSGWMVKVCEVPQGAKATLMLKNSGDILLTQTDMMFAVRIEAGEFAGKTGIVYPACVWAK